jgi:dTDP-4-dehydrorhamnose reductase
MGNKILILGASGFIGNTIYKDLRSYFDVYGTYFSQESLFGENQVFYKFDGESDDVEVILNIVQPDVIISCFTCDFKSGLKVHEQLFSYVTVTQNCKLVFISTAQVFDGLNQFPAKEQDKPLALSETGKYRLSIEKLIRQLPEENYLIFRLPLVLGVNAPELIRLKMAIKHKTNFEIFEDLVINVTTDSHFPRHLHYLINQKKSGIFHSGSTDLVHHSDLFEEITEKLGDNTPVFKRSYASNTDRFLAVLPTESFEVSEYSFTVTDVINEVTLKEEILTLKSTLL